MLIVVDGITCFLMIHLFRKYKLGEVIFFSALGCFSLYFIAEYSNFSDPNQELVFNFKNCLASALVFNGMGLSLVCINQKIRRDQQLYLRKYWQVALFFIVTAIIIMVLNYVLIVAAEGILNMSKPFCIGETGLKALFIIWLIELVIVCQFIVTNFYRNLINLYKRTIKLEESEAKRKYQILQNQLNPHFLFNNLNTLVAEIEYDPKVAVKFTCQLSDVYRYILQCHNKNTVSLREEFDFMDAYVYLHQVRLGECVDIDKNIPDDLYDAQLPPLTLQLLAENIMKHNVISESKRMKVKVYVEDDNRWLCVSNNKIPKQGVVPSGKGLENLRQRYLLLTGKEIIIENNSECFTVKVPLFYE